MKAEEIALAKVRDDFIEYCRDTNKDPESSTGNNLLKCFEIGAKLAVHQLRDAGFLLEWRTDFENARDEPVVIHHPDMLEKNGQSWCEAIMDEYGHWYAHDQWNTRSPKCIGDEQDPMPTHFAIIQPPEQTND